MHKNLIYLTGAVDITLSTCSSGTVLKPRLRKWCDPCVRHCSYGFALYHTTVARMRHRLFRRHLHRQLDLSQRSTAFAFCVS